VRQRFNRYLNAGLRVFNNDRESNRVFVEGAHIMLIYAWNSCPVLGMDLSRSLLTVHRDFHFPIDFEANRQIYFAVTDNDKKLFADNLLDLLMKNREVYVLLISEHRAAHQEYRNSQIKFPRQFKLGDIVFTNVQIQSKKNMGTVGKLAYIKRGPYKIIESYKGGSYELAPLVGRFRATIKKHGSDLYLSPQSLNPHQLVQSSEQAYANLHKKTISSPYKIIGLDGYNPIQPWSVPAATSQANLVLLEEIPLFPTVQQLDDKFDGWPESGNPFIEKASTPAIPLDVIHNNVLTLTTVIKTKSIIVADLVRSEDKLFFVSYALQLCQTRKEWKLARVDLCRSLQQYPNCLQDGRFLMKFFIEHYQDKNLDICNRIYWLEYHKTNSHKSLSMNYHILQSSQYSEATAQSMGLVPYRKWMQASDPSVVLHGPFDFATLNHQKTRARVAAKKDWLVLTKQKGLYHNPAPQLSPTIVRVDILQPIYEEVAGDREVQTRCQTLMFHVEFNDKTLRDFGGESPSSSKHPMLPKPPHLFIFSKTKHPINKPGRRITTTWRAYPIQCSR
jgi:hypothetical protein